MAASAPIAKLVWHPFTKTPYLPNVKAAATPITGVSTQAGGAVTKGRFVVLAGDDGYYDMCGDNAVLISGLAASKATTAADSLKIIPCLPGMIWAVMYAGTHTLVVGDIGNEFGMASTGKLDTDDTDNDLFTLLGFDSDWAYVSIDSTLVVGPGGSGTV